MNSNRTHRPGYTLIELIVAAGASTMLMGGLASAIFLSSQTLTPDSTASSDANRSDLVLGQVSADLRHALRFSERSATAATFTVPDRNADGKPETIRYSWSGIVGDPLLYSYNSGTAVSVAADVKQFNLTSLTRAMPNEFGSFPIASAVTYTSFIEAKPDAVFMSLAKPASVAAGDVLVALIAVERNANNKLLAGGGWHRVARLTRGGDLNVAVWWKLAGAYEPASYTFAWTISGKAYGAIMRFSGVDPLNPVNAFATATGASSAPSCPTVTTTVPNTLIVRLGGFEDNAITADNAGMIGHTTITMDSNGSAVSGGAAYSTNATAGPTGAASFALTASKDFVTVTLALKPNTGS